MTLGRTFALVFGVVYSLVGIAGFLRPFTDAPPDGLVFLGTANLLGLFAINWLHNLVHLGTGLAGLLSAASTGAARTYARTIGVVFALVFAVGLVSSNPFGLLPLNTPDNWLHLATTALALVVGFTAVGLHAVGPHPAPESSMS
jgi:hypothetical protein